MDGARRYDRGGAGLHFSLAAAELQDPSSVIGMDRFMFEAVVLFTQSVALFDEYDFSHVFRSMSKPQFPSPGFEDLFRFVWGHGFDSASLPLTMIHDPERSRRIMPF